MDSNNVKLPFRAEILSIQLVFKGDWRVCLTTYYRVGTSGLRTMTKLIQILGDWPSLKDQYGPRVFFLEFPFFAENMIIRSILNLWWHSEILKLILGVVREMFTKRLRGLVGSYTL